MVDSKVTRSIRADADTIDRFKLLAEHFNNQGECLETLIRAYEIDNAKTIESEMKSDIRSFESHTNAIYGVYIRAIETVNDLKKKNEKLAEHAKELNKKISMYESMASEEEIDSESDETDPTHKKNIGELCAQNRDLKAEVEKYKAENVKLSEELNKKTKENSELSAKLSELKAEIQIKSKQNELDLMKALNEKESQHLKKVAELMDMRDKLSNELYELKKKI